MAKNVNSLFVRAGEFIITASPSCPPDRGESSGQLSVTQTRSRSVTPPRVTGSFWISSSCSLQITASLCETNCRWNTCAEHFTNTGKRWLSASARRFICAPLFTKLQRRWDNELIGSSVKSWFICNYSCSLQHVSCFSWRKPPSEFSHQTSARQTRQLSHR